MKTIREKTWYFLVDAKTNEYLSSLLVKLYQKLDLGLNVFLVITTSSSVAAWAIWQKLSWLWIFIIGVSQLLVLIKPYLPFSKYVKLFNEKSIHWQQLSVELEELWYKVNINKIDEDIAEKSFFDLRKKSLSYDNTPDEIIFINYKRIQSKAETQCNIYLDKI